MYLCLCHSCEERSTADGLDHAQGWLTAHLEDGHAAEFRKIEPEEAADYSPSDDRTTADG